MEEDISVWKERKTESKVYQTLLDFRKNWTSRLALPSELAKLHNVFHVSMLRRYRFDESYVLPVQDIQVQSNFSYDDEPKAILARDVEQLRKKQVPLVKVLWHHHGMEKATWEPESTMKAQYL